MQNKTLLIFTLALLFFASCKQKQAADVLTTKATKGKFLIEITEEGSIMSTEAIDVKAPDLSWRFGDLKINEIIEDGSEVKTGDVLIVFDPSDINKSILEKKASLEIDQNEMEKLRAVHKSDLEDLMADYKTTEISLEISKIKHEMATYEAGITKKEIELNLEKSKISLDKAKEQIENKKKIQYEEIQQKLLEIKQTEKELEDAHKTLNSLTVTSPSNGIAIIKENWQTDNKWQMGDQPWGGSTLISLPDLSELKAWIYINEVDIAKVSQGMKVEIKADAYSDSAYIGELVHVANLAKSRPKTNIKAFYAEILIHDKVKEMLPGMTVSCKIIINELEDQLYIPHEALFKENKERYVYLKKSSGYSKTIVKTGKSNNDYIIIKDGLKEGDQIALSDPYIEEKESEKEKKDENK